MALWKISTLLYIFISLECFAIAQPALYNSKLTKRVAPTVDASCDNYPDIARGWNGALNIAQNAARVLQSEDPFSNFDTFGPVRQALFGDESLSPMQNIIGMYNNIGNGPPATIFCGEPNGLPADYHMCPGISNDNQAANLDAYRFGVEPGNSQESIDGRSFGFHDGENVVICPNLLPGGSRGFTLLVDTPPAAGRDIECFKYTYDSMFVHEMSHMFGTNDYNAYGYGFIAAKKIATDAGSGNAQNNATPLTNADTIAFFALAISQVSTPRMDAFEWSTGFGVAIEVSA